MSKDFQEITIKIIESWSDSVSFADDLARVFFGATIYTALYQAYQAGRKAETRKRKASISARYQKRLTKRAADGYAASQQSSLFAAGDEPAKVSGATRRR